MIKIKRAYDPPEPDDGKRFLVDRLWPRGVKKEDLKIEAWLKEISPSNELRKEFSHDPEHWEEFKRRYEDELAGHNEDLEALLDTARKQDITLVYAAKNTRYNNAAALKEFLEAWL
jgi:uncharacterized protein YeaO (DUF488 family)